MSSMRRLARISKFFHYLFINFVRFFNLAELYQPTYNPRGLCFIRPKSIHRNSDDRILAIRQNVAFENIRTYMDIGSQLGYFVFKIGEFKKEIVGYGLEMENVACQYANSLVFLNDVENTSFMNLKLTTASVKDIPPCDMISFLNVFHHIVHFEGFESADIIMKGLYQKCQHYFIFETGQYDEKGHYWSESLKFMGEHPEHWLQNYLMSLGYRRVILVERFPSHLSDKKRAFFVCSK